MNFINVWLGLPTPKKIMSALSVLLTVAALTGLTQLVMKPKLDLLYSGLDPAAAGEIVTRLQTMDVAYEVKGEAIYADTRRRDSLRLELAREGLPRQSIVGYELFDSMNSFAMTSEMFDTAYWRAKEGELARTILAMPAIRSARVHLGAGKTRGFSRQPDVTSASVTFASAGGITQQQAKAIQYMTALSVSGLSPEDVAVIDNSRGVIAGPGITGDNMKGQSDELERAARIKEDVLAMLEARVGIGNARVSVSLDIDRTHETTAERRFDPDTKVIRSQTSSETSQNDSGTSQNVTVASNLPDGEAGGNKSSSERSESSETVSYEISEITRSTEILPGAIKRLTVAVLVNDIASIDADGARTYQARSAEELEALQELAASASGLNVKRGDQLTIKSFPFNEPLADAETATAPGFLDQFLDQYLGNIIMSGLLAMVVLILGVFVLRPIMTTPLAPQGLPVGIEGGAQALLPMTLDGGEASLVAGAAMGLPDGTSAEPTDPIELLKLKASEQEEDAATILASWLAADNENNDIAGAA